MERAIVWRGPLFLLVIIVLLLCGVHAQGYNSTAEVPFTWKNDLNTTVLVTRIPGQQYLYFACGFFSQADNRKDFVFGIVVGWQLPVSPTLSSYSQLVWSANRQKAVRENATLQLSKDGGLFLRDADEFLVWSTNTSGAVRMNLTGNGNLVLYNENNETIWRSFDHPTDTLVPGQTLREGQMLISNTAASDWTPGPYFLSIVDHMFRAVYNTSPPQTYLNVNGSFYWLFGGNTTYNRSGLHVNHFPVFQFLRLYFNGHLKLWQSDDSIGTWNQLDYMLGSNSCYYPMVCGKYGICSGSQHCICPGKGSDATYFKYVDHEEPKNGCTPVTPLSCQASKYHHLLTLENVSFFNFHSESATVLDLKSRDSCKQACMENCSCKAAIFLTNTNDTVGFCSLQSQIFSLRAGRSLQSLDDNVRLKLSNYNKTTTFLKIQLPPSPNKKMVGSIVGASVGAFLLVAIAIVLLTRKGGAEEEDDFLEQLPGQPTKFSYEELREATKNFFQKLGEGGFGSVFQGTLKDGRQVAVKRLESVTQGKREFLAEVETIGSIHHLHLVKLIGFCAQKLHRLLVYEFMSNGSLDRWVFQATMNCKLSWQMRQKIIIQVAQGIRYLHDECIHKIAHLDIKPQNILLNEEFDAKVSDFGLAKLIDRDRSCVVTIMRGTPGYMAPEWLTSMITEKVDVYSFGIVLAEIICGRRNVDRSQPDDESALLINELKYKATKDRLADIVGKYCANIDVKIEDATELLRLAIWCLHSDHNKRPSMSLVVMVMEGAASVDSNLDLDITTSQNAEKYKATLSNDSAPLVPSILSGPR